MNTWTKAAGEVGGYRNIWGAVETPGNKNAGQIQLSKGAGGKAGANGNGRAGQTHLRTRSKAGAKLAGNI